MPSANNFTSHGGAASGTQIVDKVLGNSYNVVRRVYDSIDKVDVVNDNIENVNAVNDNITDVNRVALSIDSVNAVAAIDETISAVANNAVDISSVADNIDNINSVADNLILLGSVVQDVQEQIDLAVDGKKDLFIAGVHYTINVSTTITLTTAPAQQNAVHVYFDGVYQNKDTYTLAGTALTFTSVIDVGSVEVQYAVPSMYVGLAGDFSDLAATGGSALVGYDGGTVQDVLDSAKPLANYAALRAYSGRATSVRITEPGIAGFFRYDSADTTSADNGGTVIVAGSKRWKRVFEGAVNVKWFGAKGDWNGTTGTNDVAAFTAAFSTGKDVFTPKGKYKLSPTLVQTITNNGYQKLYSDSDATLVIDLDGSADVFSFAGPVALENLSINFNNKSARYPFKWAASAGHIVLKNLSVSNLKDINSATGSITFWLSGDGNTFHIEDIRFTSMLKKGNGVIGDAEGSLNLIYVSTASGPTQGTISNIYASEVHNINASDVVIVEDTAVIYIATCIGTLDDAKNNIEIHNCYGKNYGKRFVKAQACGVHINTMHCHSDIADVVSSTHFQASPDIGEKINCSIENYKVTGFAAYAISCESNYSSIRNCICDTKPYVPNDGNNPGYGLHITGDYVTVDGAYINTQFGIGFGDARKKITGLVCNNIYINISTKADRSYVTNILCNSSNIGFSRVTFRNIYANFDNLSSAGTAGLFNLTNGLSAPVRGENITIDNVKVISTKESNLLTLMLVAFCTDITISNVSHVNNSASVNYQIVSVTDSDSVVIKDIYAKGALSRAVDVRRTTTSLVISNVVAPGAVNAVPLVYSDNNANCLVTGCLPSGVSFVASPAWQHARILSGTTANRPTAGLVTGYSQYFDTDLGKPIWWSGAVWKDASGTTV